VDARRSGAADAVRSGRFDRVVRSMTPAACADLAVPGERAAALRLLGFCVLIALLTYGFNLFNVHLSIDNEVAAFGVRSGRIWLAQGRWGTHLLNRFVLPHPIIPVVPMTIIIVGLAGSYVLSAMTWRRPIDMAHYAAAPFALAFPVLVHISSFLSLSYAVAIGFCLSAFAVCLAATGGRGPLLVAILPLTAAIGMYQPVTMFPMVSFLTLSAIRVPAVGIGETLRRLSWFMLAVGASLALYYAIWRAWVPFDGVAPGYVGQFFKLDALVATPGSTLAEAARFAWLILSGQSDLFLEKRHAFAATVWLAGAVVLLEAWRARRSLGQFALQIVLIGAAVLSPLMIAAINAGQLPYRTLLGAPLGLAALVFVAMSTARLRLVRVALVLLSAVCLLGFVNGANRLFYMHSLVVEADRDLANRIVDRIHALGGRPESRPTPVEFVGAHSMRESRAFPRVSGSTLGASFFEWDGGNSGRIVLFMRSMGYDLRPISGERRGALLERVKTMPAWPAEGAVQRLDEIIVVKFSDYTWLQRRRLGLPG
jgi:hypothetical protein